MTNYQILKRMIDVASIGPRKDLLTCDMISQEDLFEVQRKMADLMVQIANEIPGGAELLNRWDPRTFPLVVPPVGG